MQKLGAPAPPAAEPVKEDEFDRLMGALGPFEAQPQLAAAVSGGADSVCLSFLARRWVRRRGGTLVALVVDHGLRPESAGETDAVIKQLRSLGIESYRLTWTGLKPTRGLQAAARTVRYRLLTEWCRTHHRLHLLLAHHSADQAETYLMRRRAGSGLHGLAAMPAIAERPGVRLLRPLLHTAPGRLRATLRAADLDWLEDPSNQDPQFHRSGLRREIAARGVMAPLVDDARARARGRVEAEQSVARILAGAVTMFPTGHAAIEVALLARARPDHGRRCLAALAICLGGRIYAPRTACLERLRKAVVERRLAGGRTLGGCRFVPGESGKLIVCREAPVRRERQPTSPGSTLYWDRRFLISIPNQPPGRGPYTVGGLDDRSWHVLRSRVANAATALDGAIRGSVPLSLLRGSLPVLHDLDGPCALPHLTGRQRFDVATDELIAVFCPQRSLTSAPFGLGAA